MDSSGRIHEMTETHRKLMDEHFRKKGKPPLIDIPDGEVEQLKAATKAERVAWYLKQAAFNKHNSDAERNAAKALRKKLER